MKRLGLEIAEIIIEENDDARGVFSFNVTKVIKPELKIFKVAFQQESLCFQTSVLVGLMALNFSGYIGQIPDKQFLLRKFFTINM